MTRTISRVNDQMLQVAREYLNLGFRPIPVVAGTKRAAIKWKLFQSEMPTEQDIRRWFSSGERNIALITGNGVFVVDVDDAGLVDDVLQHCGDTPMRCRTPSGGVHLYYAMRPGVRYGNAVRVRSMPIDLRCDGAYAVCPWSRSASGVSYEWLDGILPARSLPLLKASWLRRRTERRLVTAVPVSVHTANAVRRANAYLSTIEGAIAGRRGHDRTFRVACVLTVKFGLSFDEAWPLFVRWNEQCEPPWSAKELRHKLHDALKHREGT